VRHGVGGGLESGRVCFSTEEWEKKGFRFDRVHSMCIEENRIAKRQSDLDASGSPDCTLRRETARFACAREDPKNSGLLAVLPARMAILFPECVRANPLAFVFGGIVSRPVWK